jgi:dephospho-CoA kinase
MIIGITGGTGCGKTTLLNVIRDMGGTILDCDEIYHELLKTDNALLEAIEARFPGTVENGVLQRKKLGAIVFADKQELKALGRITGGAIRKEVMRRLEEAGSLVAIDAIGLFEGGYDKLCQVTVAVTAPDECRVQRLMQRDGITEEYARSRIAAQRPQAEFSALCDHTLVNDGTREDFQKKCLAFLTQLGIMKA